MTRKLEAVTEINIKVEPQFSKPGYSHLRNRLNKKHNLKDVSARGIPHQLFVFKGSWSFSKSYPAQVVLVAFRHSTLTNHHRVDQKKTSCQSGIWLRFGTRLGRGACYLQKEHSSKRTDKQSYGQLGPRNIEQHPRVSVFPFYTG